MTESNCQCVKTRASEAGKWAALFSHLWRLRNFLVLSFAHMSFQPAAVSGRNLKVSDRRAKCDTGMTRASKQQCSLSWFEMDSKIKETKYEKI